MSAMAAAVWTSTELGHERKIPDQLPEQLQLLVAHLTDYGRQVLSEELAEALASPDGAAAATRVLSAWWLTLVARHQPGYHEAMARPSPSRAEARYQTTEELKAELGV